MNRIDGRFVGDIPGTPPAIVGRRPEKSAA
jgi:hypothetical protein